MALLRLRLLRAPVSCQRYSTAVINALQYLHRPIIEAERVYHLMPACAFAFSLTTPITEFLRPCASNRLLAAPLRGYYCSIQRRLRRVECRLRLHHTLIYTRSSTMRKTPHMALPTLTW